MQCDEERASKIIPNGVTLPINDISAYHIVEGHLEDLIDQEMGMINGNALDSLSDCMEDYSYQLNDIIYG